MMRNSWIAAVVVAVFASTFGAAPAQAGVHESSGHGEPSLRLDDSTGAYQISVPEFGWSFGGSVASALRDVADSDVNDGRREYHETTFHWREGSTPLTGAIRIYPGTSVALFTLKYDQAAAKPVTPFPKFTSLPANLHVFSYADKVFSPPVFEASQDGSPWLLFDDQRHAAIISPAAHFLVARLTGNAHDGVASELNPKLANIPAGFTQQTLVAFGDGINSTWDLWGRTLTDLQGKTRPVSDADAGLKYLGYWTDNGAYYYYKYDADKGYAGTLLALADHLRQARVPIHYLQLDSWWYYKTLTDPSGKTGKTKNVKLPEGEWNRYGGLLEYKAHPAVFPEGLEVFQRKLGLPLITHNRWIDPASSYHEQYKITGVAAIDPRWWQDIASYLHSSGVITYEQDWLNQIDVHSPAFSETVDAGDAFFDGMASALKERGMTMQYCMPLPCEILEGSRYSNLTTTRVSNDRFKRDRWHDFLYVSRLASALGIWPWTDTYMSSETDNLLLSTLSAGMVGVGDERGKENRDNLLHAVREDGVIVKPDAAIVPVDSMYLSGARKEKSPLVASTYTDHEGLRTSYVFAFNDPKSAEKAVSVEPRDLGLSGPAYVYDYFAQKTRRNDANQNVTATLNGDGNSYCIIAPIGKSGIAFFGDVDKFVSNGKQRIESIREESNELTAVVLLSPTETRVRLHGCADAKPQVKVDGGAAGEVQYDPESQHFIVEVSPAQGNGASSSIAGEDPVRRLTVTFQREPH